MSLLKSITFPNGKKYDLPIGGVNFTQNAINGNIFPLLSYTGTTQGNFVSMVYDGNGNIYSFEGTINGENITLSTTNNALPLNDNFYKTITNNTTTLWIKISNSLNNATVNTMFYGNINLSKTNTDSPKDEDNDWKIIPNRLCCYAGTDDVINDLPVGSLYIQYSDSQKTGGN